MRRTPNFSTYTCIRIGVVSVLGLFNFPLYENPSSAGHKKISSTPCYQARIYAFLVLSRIRQTYAHNVLRTKPILVRGGRSKIMFNTDLMNKLMRVE